MIAWWWLLVEFVVFVLMAAQLRESDRRAALLYALDSPKAARAEMLKRFGGGIR